MGLWEQNPDSSWGRKHIPILLELFSVAGKTNSGPSSPSPPHPLCVWMKERAAMNGRAVRARSTQPNKPSFFWNCVQFAHTMHWHTYSNTPLLRFSSFLAVIRDGWLPPKVITFPQKGKEKANVPSYFNKIIRKYFLDIIIAKVFCLPPQWMTFVSVCNKKKTQKLLKH